MEAPVRILSYALALSLLMLGSAAPSFAQSNNAPIVTIFRGGATPTAGTNLSGMAAPTSTGVTVMTGMPIVSATPQQTSELPGAALATGNGASFNAGLGAGAANPNGNTAAGNAAMGAGAGVSGGTVMPPAGGGFARPVAGGTRGGFGFK